MKAAVDIIAIIIITFSIILIYNAREIVKNRFNSNEVNDTTKTLKIVGTILIIVGLVMIYIVH